MLWILGEYTEDIKEIQEIFRELRKVLGEIPILASEQRLLEEASAEDGDEKKDDDEDDIPDLVEGQNFEGKAEVE